MSNTQTGTLNLLHSQEQGASLQNTLRDYELHISGLSTEKIPATRSQQSAGGVAQNPPNWPTYYRRVPPYRPINYDLDLTERPNGTSTTEYFFVTVMLNGVRMQSAFVCFWESTGGRWYPQLTRYKIGGEW